MSTSLDRGRALREMGRPEEAADALREALREDPQDLDALCELALAQLGAGDADEAVKTARIALHEHPDEEWAHRVASVALRGAGRMKESEAAAREAVRIAPDEALTHLALGHALRSRGRLREAQQEGEEALSLEPDSGAPSALLGLVALDRRQWSEAEYRLRVALVDDPDDDELLNNLGVALQNQGRRDEAQALFHSAAAADPRSDVARSNLANSTRSFVNGTLALAVTSWLVVQVIGRSLAEGKWERAAIAGPIVLAIAWVVTWNGRRRRVAQLSPAQRALLADQSWVERTQVTRLRPITWFIPSTVWCPIGALLTAGLVAAGQFDLAAIAAAFTALTGFFAWRRWQRR